MPRKRITAINDSKINDPQKVSEGKLPPEIVASQGRMPASKYFQPGDSSGPAAQAMRFSTAKGHRISVPIRYLLQLQRQYGNHFVQREMAADTAVNRLQRREEGPPGIKDGGQLLPMSCSASSADPSGAVRTQSERPPTRSFQRAAFNRHNPSVVQREDGDEDNLDRLDEMLDRFNVPEEEVIRLCGQLTPSEKATVVAGGYKSKMASALNVGEMVRAVNALGPELRLKLEWVNAASILTRSIDYADISAMVTSAPAAERNALKTDGWKGFFVDVCTNETMVQALNDLGYDLETKLSWLHAEMTITSWELDYATIQPWITAAPQTERDALKTAAWKGFFVDVCTNETMVQALNDLGYDLETKLSWLHAEMTITSWELDYATIQPWITGASQAERNALKTAAWKGFFVDVCTNETMVQALNDLGYDLETKLSWLHAEMTITSWELDYATIQPWITAASQGERDGLKTDAWKDFFVDVCTNATMEQALVDLGFDMETQVRWMIAESDAETVLETNSFMTRVRAEPNFTVLMKILVDVSALPAGKIQDATAELAGSTELVDRNTAERILAGDVIPYYIENLAQPPNINAIVTGAGLSPAVFTVYLAPNDNSKNMLQRLADQGFTNANAPGYIFGLMGLPVVRWKTILVHETSHSVNADEEFASNSFERYKGEFRAYWIAEFRNVANLNQRAQQIKQHILNSYPQIQSRYNTDAAFKALVDGHTRPDGNITNE